MSRLLQVIGRLCAVLALFHAPAPFAGTAVNDGVVRVLVITDLSGVFRDIAGPGSATAARMAAADFGGRTRAGGVEVVVHDSLLDPEHAASVAERVHDETPVDVIVGHVPPRRVPEHL